MAKIPTQWNNTKYSGSFNDLSDNSGDLLVDNSGNNLITNEVFTNAIPSTAWTHSTKNDSAWVKGVVSTITASNVVDQLGNFLVDQLGNFVISGTTKITPVQPTAWTAV